MMQPKKSDLQRNFLCPDLRDQLDPRNHLLGLAKVIPRHVGQNNFRPLFAASGCPGKTARLMGIPYPQAASNHKVEDKADRNGPPRVCVPLPASWSAN